MRLSEPRLTPCAKVVGENLPVVKTVSSPSREFRAGPTLGTCRVWRCFNCADPGCCEVGDGFDGAGYDGGDENRWGEAVAARVGVSGAKEGVAGTREEAYVKGPVLWGFVEIGGGRLSLFVGSLSPFVTFVSVTFPFVVDATELLSPFEVLDNPFCLCSGLLLPFSFPPFTAPLNESALPFLDDLWSQLPALDRPFGSELRFVSWSISPLLTCGRPTLPPSV